MEIIQWLWSLRYSNIEPDGETAYVLMLLKQSTMFIMCLFDTQMAMFQLYIWVVVNQLAMKAQQNHGCFELFENNQSSVRMGCAFCFSVGNWNSKTQNQKLDAQRTALSFRKSPDDEC